MRLPERLRRNPSSDTLRTWNIWLAALYALQAVAVLLFGSSQLFSVTSSYVEVDSVQSTSSATFVLAPASHHVVNVNVLLIVFLVLAVLAAVHAAQAWWLRTSYEAHLKKAYNPTRWASYGVTASLLFLVLALLAGVHDITTLLLLLVLGIVLHGLCVWVERIAQQRGKAHDNARFGYGLIVLAGAGMWLIVANYLLAANIFGSGHIPERVYWLALTAAVTSLSFAFGLYRQMSAPKTGQRYRLTEARYMILTLLTTSFLAWQVVAGTMR